MKFLTLAALLVSISSTSVFARPSCKEMGVKAGDACTVNGQAGTISCDGGLKCNPKPVKTE